MKAKTPRKRLDYRHYICWALIALSGVLAVLLYRFSYSRAWDACRDIAYSLRYYFVFLFTGNRMPVTVTQLPEFDLSDFIPFTVEEIQRKLTEMWGIIFNGENFMAYFGAVLDGLRVFTMLLLILLPVFLIAKPVFRNWLIKATNRYRGKQRPSVLRFRRVAEDPFRAVMQWVRDFLRFAISHAYLAVFLIVWAFNLNVVTILLEFFAFYFYFVMSLDFPALFLQLVKLLIDLIVMFAGAPLIFWLTVAAAILDAWRKEIGFCRLDRFERKNREFMEEQPLVIMITGTMGKKKTTLLTDIALSEEIRFRDKALELMLEQFSKYPNFPFVNLEAELKRAIEYHQVYTLVSCRDWARKKSERFRRDPCPQKLFGYEIDRYALQHNDNLMISPITQMIEDYACLFFIYTVQSSLIVSNYAIRTDGVLDGEEHFPLWDSELFRKKPEAVLEISQHSHILDFDMLRLGKKMLKDNENAGAFEFGVVDITEIGKERGNNLILQEIKRLAAEANQKNDLFNHYLKMCRHLATVCNFPFIRILTDDQRAESWGADARDLCTILHIQESGKFKCMMPLFFIEDLIHDLLYPKFEKWLISYRHNRSDVSLPFYVINNIMTALHRYRQRVYNLYGESILTLEQESGTMDGKTVTHQIYISSKKDYSDRFATDSHNGFFAARTRQSKKGLNDLPTYAGTRATIDELHQQNSYFVGDMEKLSEMSAEQEQPKDTTKKHSGKS